MRCVFKIFYRSFQLLLGTTLFFESRRFSLISYTGNRFSKTSWIIPYSDFPGFQRNCITLVLVYDWF